MIYVLGSINMDLVISVDLIPLEGETKYGENFFRNPGGKGANQAVAISKSGQLVNFIGKVGNQFGDDLIETLKINNILTENISKDNSLSSGVAVIILEDLDNRIIIDPGSNYSIKLDEVEKGLKQAKKSDILLMQYEIPLNIIESALKIAKEKGMITFFNPAPAKEIPTLLFKNIDFLIMNQTETQKYSNIYPNNLKDCINASNVMKDLGVKNILITLGSKGSVLIGDRIIEQSAYKVKPVDTTAAGDTFIGAFVAQFSINKSIEYCMRYASAASAISVTRFGAQKSIPFKDEVLDLLNNPHF